MASLNFLYTPLVFSRSIHHILLGKENLKLHVKTLANDPIVILYFSVHNARCKTNSKEAIFNYCVIISI